MSKKSNIIIIITVDIKFLPSVDLLCSPCNILLLDTVDDDAFGLK